MISRRIQRLLLPSILVLALAIIISVQPTRVAKADYTPSQVFTYGPEYGLQVMNQGTSMSHSDPVGAWNMWTGTSNLWVGTTNCGVSVACAIFAWEGATIWDTDCVVPDFDDGSWAKVYVSADGYENFPGDGDECDLGTTTYPVYVISVETSISFNDLQKKHIRRHEIGHALTLADTPTACWESPPSSDIYYPLMHNVPSTCGGYWSPKNGTATANESSAAVSWNNW